MSWCQAIGYAADCVTYTGQGQGQGLGEFQWPADMMDLYKQIMARGSEFMNKQTGYSDQAMAGMFGPGFENIRGEQGATRQSILQNLSDVGMLGTGVGGEAINKTAWEGEKKITDLLRDLFVKNEEKKLTDLMTYTGGAKDIFGAGQGFWQALEAINAGRRGEGLQALAMMLELLGQLGQQTG